QLAMRRVTFSVCSDDSASAAETADTPPGIKLQGRITAAATDSRTHRAVCPILMPDARFLIFFSAVMDVYLLLSFPTRRSKVHDHHRQDNDQKYHGGQCPQCRLNLSLSSSRGVHYICADRVKCGRFRVCRNKIVIQRQCNRQHKP